MFNVPQHIQNTIEALQPIEFPLTTSVATLLLQAAGYRANTFIFAKLSVKIGNPPGNPPHFEWGEDDLIRYATELHRYRAWLFWAHEFDDDRTQEELLQVKTDRKELTALTNWCHRVPFGAIGVLLAEETRPQFRVALSHELMTRHIRTMESLSEKDEF